MAKKKSEPKKSKPATRILSNRERRNLKRQDDAAKGKTSSDAYRELDAKSKEQVKVPRDENYHRMFTGIIDIDLAGVSVIGRRVQLMGKPNLGKSLLAYILGGAAQKTCRLCFTPIIPWMGDWSVYQSDPKDWEKRLETLDFDTTVTCSCGSNDPMRVMLIDTEDCYDRYWSSLWGLQAHVVDSLTLAIDEDNDEPVFQDIEFDDEGHKHTLFLCKPESSDTFEQLAMPLIRSGAIDMVIIDSIAALALKEDLDGFKKIASRARFLKRILPLLQAMQLEAKTKFGTRCGLVITNHITEGPVANPKMNSISGSGGWAFKHHQDISVNIVSSRNNTTITDGHKVATVTRDITFKVPKSKVTPGNRSGDYRLYLDDYKKSENISYVAGESNEPENLLAYLKEINNPDLYRVEMKGKAKVGYFLLGRVFKRVKDMVTFLKRRDIQFLLRPILMAELKKVSITERMHIDIDGHCYGPYGEYLKDQIYGYAKEVGEHFFKTRVSYRNRRKAAGEEL